MTCQNLGVLCLHWSIFVVVMATVVIGTLTAEADTKPRLIPPEIIDGPHFHVIFHADQDRKDLPCYATGTPPIVYKWLFNGEEVHSGDRIRIVDGRLHLGNPTSDMAGYYQCIATNEAGVAISNITFLQAAVFEELPPRVRNTIHHLSIKELNHVVLPCNHIKRSVPSALITWEMSTDGGHHFRSVNVGGGHVTQAQDGSLVFSIARQNNSAIYKCIATNSDHSFGGSKVNLTIEAEDASEADRILKELPVLLYASPNVTVLEGKELRIECLYGAWPDHHVEWTTPSGVTNVSHAWMIGSVTAADAGVYSCRAFKSFHDPRLFSPSVNITVQVDAIPSFAAPMSNQEVPESGRDVTFTCQGRGRPSPTVTWYKNGVSVEKLEDVLNDHSISGDGPTSVLVLRSIRTSATVTCNVSNTHGSRLQSAVVTIGDAEVISSTSSQHVIITSPMTSANKHHSTRHHERTTKPLQPYQPSTTSYHSSTTVHTTKNKDDEHNKDKTNGPAAPHVKPEPLSSSTTTTIIIAAAVSAVAVLVVIIVVVVIIVCRRRRRRGGFSLPEQGMPLRAEVRIANLQTYDSDDSGFDDVKAESERRALQGHQPPS